MKQVVIENPILNSPFDEPKRHFKFAEEGITNEIIEERRISTYFIPIAKPKKKGKQLSFDTEWTEDRIKENEFINQVRDRVSLWREKKKEKEVKVATARDFWVPAVNNHGGFGKWAFLEILDPWNTKSTIREFLETL